MTAGALCALAGLASSCWSRQPKPRPTFGLRPFAPGSVVVSQGGTIFGGTNAGTGVELNGEVDVYPPNANGDVRPEASFTNGSYGPTTMVFDSSGDLWVANENTSDLFEVTRAQLATPRPGASRDHLRGGRGARQPLRYGFRQLGQPLGGQQRLGARSTSTQRPNWLRSGAPTPVTTISDFPSTPIFGDAFDASGDLWVSTVNSVVEFSKVELATPNPAPTVTISSSGGAQLVFDPSGDLWMVTGGGPDCFGTPCTNEVVEFTKAQLSTPGSPAPAVTISFDRAWQPHRVPVRPLLARLQLLG